LHAIGVPLLEKLDASVTAANGVDNRSHGSKTRDR
jgi:hypothetical protein